jgi:transcriptional regulator with XRE-family HTH domain
LTRVSLKGILQLKQQTGRCDVVRLRIRELAEERGWNAAKLARRADLSNNAVYGIWNGETTDPGLLTLAAIARALEVKIRDLIDEDEEQGPHATIDEHIEAPMLAA